MAEPRVRDILIVGGTIAGWLTAAILARSLPRELYHIRLLDAATPVVELETLGGGLATLPALRTAHALLGLPEAELGRSAGAGFSLGADYAGWPRPGGRYFRPFGGTGAALDGVAFHNLWQRMRRASAAGELEDYALGAVAARLGRFAPPSSDRASVLSTLDYGYHLDGEAYRQLLRAAALQHGVLRIEGEPGEVRLRGTDGWIEAVAAAGGGEPLVADFFIDCTGAKACLLGEALSVPFEDWTHWLPCDRAVAVRESGEVPFPFLRVEAQGAGWQWRMPLREGAARLRVFASAHEQADGAVAFASGRRARFWERNCVAIGAAASLLDPLEPASLQAVQRGISQFLLLMPFKDDAAGEAEEYNRIMTETVERMRDLVILHYKANRREEPFWRACREMQVPDILAYKIRLFEAKAKILALDEEMFRDEDWAAVYLGQGVQPRAYDVLADAPDKALVRDQLAGMRKAINAAAEATPPYAAFLQGQPA
ncbi:MAG TPA: tryptophan halogenase family protein [Allosphingosinicella sp.]|nr:tryptophan halogenase family protein [Allosphingosinicella sp.]